MAVTDRKYPKDKTKHLGLEVEFISPLSREAIAAVFTKSKNASLYHLHNDGSVRDGHGRSGHEISVVFKQSQLLSILRTLSADLKKVEADVNRTCGMHVHLDMRSRNLIQSFKRLALKEKDLFSLVKKDRAESLYCKKIMPPPSALRYEKDIERHIDSLHHHSSIDAKDAYNDHKTIEVRMHHGTVNFFEILNWIRLLLTIVDDKPLASVVKQYVKRQKEKMRA